jgi:hypothetical protein
MMVLHQVVPRLGAMNVSGFHLRPLFDSLPKKLNFLDRGAGMLARDKQAARNIGLESGGSQAHL